MRQRRRLPPNNSSGREQQERERLANLPAVDPFIPHKTRKKRGGGGNPPAMGGRRPCFLALVLVLAILCASFPEGFARNIKVVGLDKGAFGKALEEVAAVRVRGTAELGFSTMDYAGPGANRNPWAGWVSPPPGPQD